MNHILLMTLGLVLNIQLPPTHGYINCRTACKKCRFGLETLDLIEVYCSMCKECRDSRREKTGQDLTWSTTTPIPAVAPLHKIFMPALARQKDLPPDDPKPPPVINRVNRVSKGEIVEAWPEGCPTPPVCESNEIQILTNPVITTTTPTSTTKAATCPPVATCKPKKPTTPNNCMTPCMPMCGCDNPQNIKVEINWKDLFTKEDHDHGTLRKDTITESWLENNEAPQKLSGDVFHNYASTDRGLFPEPIANNMFGNTASSQAWSIPVSFNGRLSLEGQGSLVANGLAPNQNNAIRSFNRDFDPNNENQQNRLALDINPNGGPIFNNGGRTTASVPDYFYVYLGVPKNALNPGDA